MNETAGATSLDSNKLLGFKRLLALPETAAERRTALGAGFNKAGEVPDLAHKVGEAEASRAAWATALDALASKISEVP